jgi:hypothetical protein
MEATPNTFNYMVSGYLVFAVLMSVYITSLIIRWNNLKHDQQMLDEIEKQNNQQS